MKIRCFSICSRLSLDSLRTIGTFNLTPSIFRWVCAVRYDLIYIHSDIITIRIRNGETDLSIRAICISNMRIRGFATFALWSLDSLITLIALQAAQSLLARISLISFRPLKFAPTILRRIGAVSLGKIHVLAYIRFIDGVGCRKACLSIRACCISDMQITGFTIRTVFSRGSIGAVLSVIALKFSPGVLGRICTVLQYIVHIGTDIFSCILPQLICCRVRNISISHMEETSQTILSGLSRNSLLSNNLYPGIDARVCKYRLFCRLIVCDTHVCLSS